MEIIIVTVTLIFIFIFILFFVTTGRSADHPLVKEILGQYFPYEVYMNETTGNALH